jgi:putative ABC transport system permease protein
MNLLSHFQQALINLNSAKLRSLLAVLGILVGTAAVVALMSCGELATEKALEQFKALGTDLLAVSLFQQTSEKSGGNEDQLPLSAWREIPEYIKDIKQIAPYGTTYQSMSFQGKPIQGAIVGADESLAKIIHIELARGHFVSFVESFEHFCVIGDNLARQLQAITVSNLIGQQLQIGQALYTIIGIAKPWKENGFFNEDINQAVIIPIAGLPIVAKDSKINNAVLQLREESEVDNVIEQIKQLIVGHHPKLNVFARSAKQIISSMENQGKIFTLLLAVIGGISLLVGGIGVMNIMLVSVSERKKEIGIRKAVGARNREIQTLFLLESITLSFLGGTLGVLLGQIFTWIFAYFSHWTFSILLMPPLAGFAVSVATGIFFGFYPARRAAKLETVISLRSE